MENCEEFWIYIANKCFDLVHSKILCIKGRNTFKKLSIWIKFCVYCTVFIYWKWFERYALKVWLRSHLNIVTRNNIVRKLAHGYCLCYCKTFSLVPDSTECTEIFVTKMCHLNSNNIIGQSKTTNTEKHFHPWLTSFNLTLSCT